MSRWIRNALVLLGPPLGVTAAAAAYGIPVAAWLSHFTAILLGLITLGMAVRLRWSPATVLLPARFLVAASVGAAWSVVWSLVLFVAVERNAVVGAITSYAPSCALTSAVALGSSFILSRMLRRAPSTTARPRPWTTFA